MRTLVLSTLMVVLAGCASAPSTDSTAGRASSVADAKTALDAKAAPTPAHASDAATASVPATDTPQIVVAITDQRMVYDCPKCGMEYDRAGQCGMCHVDLEPVRLDYLCPADGKPVERAGRCPRCAVDAKIVRTAMAVNLPPTLRGN
jgi:predicted RNA-binding Zn-ribbon protein involved in translation (DUF1610 family)